MTRPHREKSTSVSSAAAPAINGIMPPPSPPASSARSSSAATRRKAPSVSKVASDLSKLPPPKSAHAPAKPSYLKFIGVVLISLLAESVAQTVASEVGAGELAGISKGDPSPFEVGALLAWKVTLLGICWFGGFDAIDVASLNTLLQTPIFVLLHYFYLLSVSTLITTCTISILSQALPFYLLRPLSAPHAASSTSKSSLKLRNRTIIVDPITTLATAFAATAIYATTLQLAFSFFLPTFLIVHFEGLRDLSFAYNIGATLPALFVWLAPAGIASTQFLFRPAEGAVSSSNTATGANSVAIAQSHFDPETSTFVEHIRHNVWGWYTSRQKELIGRTITLGAILLIETVIHLVGSIKGVEVLGAFGYAATWLVGVSILGAFLDWVGTPSD